MGQRRYWVVSPNVDNYEKTVEDWKRLIVDNHWAIMGYGPKEKTGKKKKGNIGSRFASIPQEDIILVARSRMLKDVVGAGVVVTTRPELKHYPELRRDKKPVQVRELKNFKDLRDVERPDAITRALGVALPTNGSLTKLHDDNDDREVKKWLNQLLQVDEQYDDKSDNSRGLHQPDIERRQEVEREAYKTAEKYYREKKYHVNDVQKDNCGYDLEATKNGDTLRVEVKGRSDHIVVAELTPNEYNHFIQDDNYRLCIVTNALNRKPKKHIQEFIFNSRKRKWFDQDGKELIIEERMGARVRG